jgi:anti-sigma-K factor RskA
MSHEDFEGLAAGYGLYALEPDDEQRLAMHLLTCLSCSRLVADSASITADLVGMLEPMTPPAALRARIMAAVAADETDLAADSKPATAASADGSFRWIPPWLRRRAVIGVLAAIVGIGVAIPVTLAASDHGSAAGEGSTLAQSLLNPQARVITLTASGGVSHAKAVVAEQGVYLVARGLAVNDSTRSTYVMWLVSRQGKPSAIATFDVRSKATVELAAAKLPLKQSDISKILVSYEPGRSAPAKPSKIELSGSVS